MLRHMTQDYILRGDFAMDLVLIKVELTGFIPKELFEKFYNSIKADCCLTSSNDEKLTVDGLDVEVSIVD